MKRFIPFVKKPAYVPVIRLSGAIGGGARGLSDAGLAPLVERAFSRGKPAAVALVVNGFVKDVLQTLPMEFAM